MKDISYKVTILVALFLFVAGITACQTSIKNMERNPSQFGRGTGQVGSVNTNIAELSVEEAYALFSKYEAAAKKYSFLTPAAAEARTSAEQMVNEFCMVDCTKASQKETIEEIKKSLELSAQASGDTKLATKSLADFMKTLRTNPYGKVTDACDRFTFCEQVRYNQFVCKSGVRGQSEVCSTDMYEINFEINYYDDTIRNVNIFHRIAG
ncbi:MAG: hypothetical protein V4654_02935 [Bdellovibrionota bacterium]